MSNETAEKRQAFERWVASIRGGAQAEQLPSDEESGITSFDEQATIVKRLPKEMIRRLRERESSRGLPVDQDCTAVFVPPPELLARARRMTPPKKPEQRSGPSVPPETASSTGAPRSVRTGRPARPVAATRARASAQRRARGRATAARGCGSGRVGVRRLEPLDALLDAARRRRLLRARPIGRRTRHPLTQSTCLSSCTTSTRSRCAAITASIDL